MTTNLYSVYDKKASFFSLPFGEVNDVCAERQFKNQYTQHPYRDDFALYQVGTLDTESGIITSGNPRFVVSYDSFVEVAQNV